MKILVDADSCPAIVRETICRAAQRCGVKAVFAANREIPGLSGKDVFMELCPQGEGEADKRLVLLAEKNDLAVTRDVPLASLLVEKGVFVLDDHGRIFTSENIRAYLSIRDFQV
ncbi:MAG: DUF188 domain-containing protein, partial [Spirochaetaceae bacterium]|nr:DUF188 domain-containing protein [Spirochaetaceae bacterium]